MSAVATELGTSLPLSVNNPWVIALAGKTGLPLSASDLLGKSGNVNTTQTVQQAGNFNYFISVSNLPFFDAQINSIGETNAAAYLAVRSANTPSIYTGKIKVTNTTLGRSLVLSYVGGGVWGGSSGGGAGGIGISFAAGQTFNFTIYPSN